MPLAQTVTARPAQGTYDRSEPMRREQDLPAPVKMEDQLNTDERPLLAKIAGTLEAILSEMRKGNERHKELDESNAAAEYKLQNPYENV